MSSSFSFETPMASFSAAELTINTSQNAETRESSYSSAATSMPQRHRTITSGNPPIKTAENICTQADNDHEEDSLLTARYDKNRIKQERLLLIINIFRVLVICVFALLIYFIL
ncbi:hypothetical protein I4U23_017931 [Adineta vaga]|nr:hypothetical protein I4U23_017931 [Adineta vaga]